MVWWFSRGYCLFTSTVSSAKMSTKTLKRITFGCCSGRSPSHLRFLSLKTISSSCCGSAIQESMRKGERVGLAPPLLTVPDMEMPPSLKMIKDKMIVGLFAVTCPHFLSLAC